MQAHMEPGLYFRKGDVAKINNTRDTGQHFHSCNSFIDAEMSNASDRLRATDQSDDL